MCVAGRHVAGMVWQAGVSVPKFCLSVKYKINNVNNTVIQRSESPVQDLERIVVEE